ncbi:MAG: hypothetical protein N3A53_05440, partial [Verrucomicrobiae bacterium]|nr:hypothetical protein [Verrucomicrobiae bacterium]
MCIRDRAGTLLSARTIRIEPALNISYELLEKMLDRLADTLKEVEKSLDKETREKVSREARTSELKTAAA